MLLGPFAGARNDEQASGNAAAGKITLTEKELADIDEMGRSVTDYLDDNRVMWSF